MNMKRLCSVAILPLMFAFGACGSSHKEDNTAAPGASGSPAASTGGTQWAADACKTFPAAAVARVTGEPFTKTELNANQNDDAPATVSSCNYSTADGNSYFTILFRQDRTVQDTVDAQAAGLTVSPDMTGKMEPVTMPRGKAFWSSRLHTLSYVPDNARMIVVTPPHALGPGKKADAELQKDAIALASAVPL